MQYKGDFMTNLEKILDDSINKVPDFPKQGILFYDITSLLTKPKVFDLAVKSLSDYYKNKKIDGIIAIESRGFIFGSPIALALEVPLLLARKKGKLPRKTISADYSLEYGTATIELHREDLIPDKNYLIIDDLIATGGTINAIANLVEQNGGKIAGIGAVIGLPFLNYQKILGKYDVKTLINYSSEDFA